MPSKPLWFKRIRQIRDSLEGDFPTPWLDRTTIGELFAVSKRRAHALMCAIGAHRIGGAYAVSRQDLLSWLDCLERSPEVQQELRRRQRIHEVVEEARAHRVARQVTIRVGPSTPRPEFGNLPATIALQPGLLRIEFRSAEDLLRQLYELGQAVMNDYERFQKVTECDSERPRQSLVV